MKTYVIVWYDGDNQQAKAIVASDEQTVLDEHQDQDNKVFGSIVSIGHGGLDQVWLNNGNGWELQNV